MTAEKGFDICALSETKLKGSGDFTMAGIKGVKARIGDR
jgi:hypothetical protein